jgi:PBP1b-binding outer membrane lipoprotein LpoB
MTRIRIVASVPSLALIALLALLLTACASRPSEEELTEAILAAASADADVELDEEQAACIARQLIDSDLSDTTLAGLAENFDAPQVLQTEVDEVKAMVEEAALTCV